MAINYEFLTATVKKAARDAHSSFPAHHEVGDTEQTLWLWVFENKKTVDNILYDTARRTNEIVKPIYNLLVKVATTHLRREDNAVYGYAEEDVFYYSTELIKSILEVCFQHEDWQSFASALDAMPKSKVDPATAGNTIASYIDVKGAAERLPDNQYNALVWRYKYSYTLENVGEELGITKEAARKLIDRAVGVIQKDLGKKERSDLRNASDGHLRPSTRAQAQAMLEQQYDG